VIDSELDGLVREKRHKCCNIYLTNYAGSRLVVHEQIVEFLFNIVGFLLDDAKHSNSEVSFPPYVETMAWPACRGRQG
jgi:hypothetical protein